MNLIFTLGDCNGIGIEVMIKSIITFDILNKSKNNTTNNSIEFAIIANTRTLREYLSFFDFNVEFLSDSVKINDRICKIFECDNYSPVDFGKETLSAGRLAKEALIKSFDLLKTKKYDAVVTMPVSKHSLHLAGWSYPGQTEYYTEMSHVDMPLMILCTSKIRVSLATIHVPIKSVSAILNIENIKNQIGLFSRCLANDYNIKDPKIAVLSLNPHAGENGDIGSEENDIIIPAINNAKSNGLKAFGPFASDGFFAHGDYKQFDGILAMYHDQGLIPLKLLADGGGVNYSGNLPIIRTSPDHGTGFAISGTNIANHQSTLDAIELAISIAQNRKCLYENN